MITVTAEPFPTDAEHLAAELAWLNLVLRPAVLSWRAQAGAATDVFKGLYISDEEVDRLVGGVDGDAAEDPPADDAAAARASIDARVAAAAGAGIPLALPGLACHFALSPFEVAVVVLAVAPEVDPSYERIFAYLQDDLSRKRPTVGLAVRLFGPRREDRVAGLRAFSPRAPLFRRAVLRPLDEADGPLPARRLEADRLTVASLLFAGDGPDLDLDGRARVLRADRPLDALALPAALRRNLLAAVGDYVSRPGPSPERLICHLHGPGGGGGKTLAAAVCREVGVPLLLGDARDLVRAHADPEDGLRDLFRQAIHRQSAVYLDHLDAVAEGDAAAPLLRRLSHAMDEFSWLTFVSTRSAWKGDGLFARHRFLSLELPGPGVATRRRLWTELAAEAGVGAAGVRWDDLAARFRLTPGAIAGAIRSARTEASTRGPDAAVTTADLVRGCYSHSSQRLGALARKLPIRRGWDDLTLPRTAVDQLREICAHVRHRRLVCDDWGFNGRFDSPYGLCALFHGASGAGKTTAVEVIAGELELEVYKIDLSSVVSKYIGETEKNLSRIFEAAESSNAILFFDEADALFGKRSEVKDAHDRYANIEISYLLQKIEDFEGLVVLASNLRKNIDEGFFRRMKFSVEFTLPDASHRYRIWRQHFPEAAPVAADVDLGFLAGRFPLAGGNIRNIVVNAAFLAAGNGGEIRMEHLIRATRREYDKTGRVCTEAEFAPYAAFLTEGAGHHA